MGLCSILLGLGLLLSGGAAPSALCASPSFGVAIGESTGKVFLTKEEALALAYKGCVIERSTVYLTPKQKAQVQKLAGFKVKTSVAYVYAASKAGKLVGYAWFDVAKVRSKKQSVLFAVNPNGTIRRFELLAFGEPAEYIPRANWYAQLLGKRLDNRLKLKQSIKSVTGATLTARATVKAARRVLALQATLFPVMPKPSEQPAK